MSDIKKIKQLLNSSNPSAGFEILKTLNDSSLIEGLYETIDKILKEKYFNDKNKYLEGCKIASSIPFYMNHFKRSNFNNENFSFTCSFIRKSIALDANTSKELIVFLIKDEYRWVREAAASNPCIKPNEISEIIKSSVKNIDGDLIGDRYVLKGLLNNPNITKKDKNIINNKLKDGKLYPWETTEYIIETLQPEAVYEELIPFVISLYDLICFELFDEDGEDFIDALHYWRGDFSSGEIIFGEYCSGVIEKWISCDGSMGPQKELITVTASSKKQSGRIRTGYDEYVSAEKEPSEYMKNGQFLINGEYSRVEGNGNTYYIDLENEIELDKIQAITENNLIQKYTYLGKDNLLNEGPSDFDCYDDYEMEGGDVRGGASVFWDGELHGIDFYTLIQDIEEAGFKLKDKDGNIIEENILKYFKKIYSK